ncbi:MAG: NTP transferase domain-containing protein [Acidimicrobiales bacterium]|nr:NTP transferase domain-containing protein [Acidimicrobiales bacterium]HRW37245.1 sugar phosphate nucleotidyltransferase [Aquihabitans sp.]
MKAVIMAGGEGTRLRPLTSNCPKPMLPLANRPMMEHIVGLLKEHGIDEIVVTVAFLANQIRTYFGDGSEFGVKMVYATEDQPLGTAGSVRNAMDVLDERFLVISGDVLTDIDLGKILAFHEEKGAMATIGLVHVDNPLEFGIVITKEDGSIERFLEKPTWGQVFSDTINTGIFVLEPEIFDYIPDGRPVDFSGEVFPALLADGRALYGAVAEGYWEDVGTLESYVSAHKDVMDGKVQVDVPGFEFGQGVWIGEGAEVHPDAKIEGFAIVGENSRVEAGARIGDYTVLGGNVRVRGDADLERSVVHDNAYLAENVRLRGSVIGRASDLRRGARCDEGSVIGDECFIGDDAHVGGGVKIYPFKTVEAGATINSSIIWESKGARSLFGRDGVSGLANVDISPELAARVAMAFATTLRKDATVITSRDSSRAARMLKRAFMAGLNASGVNVLDLEVAPVPVTRFLTRQPVAAAGVTIRLVEDDSQSVVIRFFDRDGIDITEDAQRKIERLFGREDFRRVLASEIGDIGFPPRALEHYTAALGETVDLAAVRAAGFKLVIDYSYGATAFVMPNVLSKLGADVLGVNPYASTRQAINLDRDEAIAQVSALVKASGAHLGALIDPDGEHLTLVDDTGHPLTDDEARLAYVSLVGGHLVGDRIALPVNVSSAAEELVGRHDVRVQHTKTSTAALMAAASESGVGFAASGDGGFILPGFLPAFDAGAALIKLLELLALEGTSLSSVRESLPRTHLAHETVVTPWEQKGLVMRTLVELSKDRRLELIDGVKVIHEDGWVLALPDPEEPVTHIWAEGPDAAAARALAQEYVRRIRQTLR